MNNDKAAPAEEPFSMLIHAIERDLERTPDGRGGEIHYIPETPRHGGMGHHGDYLLREWREVTDALAAVTTERDQARQMLADAPHDKSCRSYPEFMAFIGSAPLACTCWKAEL